MWDKGTNLHHALLLANRHFRKHPNAQPVLLIVTDGEPTSHLEPDGEVYFSYPPHPLTDRLQRPRARRRPPGSARRRRSSGWARTPAWPASSSRWPAGSTDAWSRPSSTTSAPPWSAATSAPATPGASYRDHFGGDWGRGFWVG